MTTAKEVKDYLNYLSDLKKSIKFPMSLEIDDSLYKIFDGDGRIIVTFSKEVYEIFQEL